MSNYDKAWEDIHDVAVALPPEPEELTAFEEWKASYYALQEVGEQRGWLSLSSYEPEEIRGPKHEYVTRPETPEEHEKRLGSSLARMGWDLTRSYWEQVRKFMANVKTDPDVPEGQVVILPLQRGKNTIAKAMEGKKDD